MPTSTPPPHARALGLDIGRRRTGIAVSDPGARLATPLETVELPIGRLVAHVRALAARLQVSVVVIGLPRLPSGEKGEVAFLAEAAGDRLKAAGLTVRFWDEALTSWEAQEILSRRRPGRRPGGTAARRMRQRRDGELDRVAAALILQDYLDAARRERGR
jgi:putative Holliday junction resolvase